MKSFNATWQETNEKYKNTVEVIADYFRTAFVFCSMIFLTLAICSFRGIRALWWKWTGKKERQHEA